MKRLLTLFLSLILCTSLAGCSDTTDTALQPSSPPASSTNVQSTAPPSEEPEASTPSDEAPALPPVTTEPSSEITADTPVLPADSSFSIHYIDVGQADAALVECDGHYMLIDGGNKADSNVIYSVLRNNDVPKLDIVVGTHAHEDHIGGLPGAFNYTTSDITLCPTTNYDSDAFSDFKKYADKSGGGITVPSVGDAYTLGSSTVTILGVNDGNDTNDTSIVLKITYGSTAYIFTGDAERETEQAILNRGCFLWFWAFLLPLTFCVLFQLQKAMIISSNIKICFCNIYILILIKIAYCCTY